MPKGAYEAVAVWEQDGETHTARGTLTAEAVFNPAAPAELVLAPEAPAPAASDESESSEAAPGDGSAAKETP